MTVRTLTSWISEIGTSPDPPAAKTLRCGAMARFFGASRERSSYRHIPDLLTHWLRGYDTMHVFLTEGGVLACPFCLDPRSLRVFPGASTGDNLDDWLRRQNRHSGPYSTRTYRSGAFARLAGHSPEAPHYYRSDVWRSAYDAIDGFLAQGGTLRCPCCDRHLSPSKGRPFPPNSQWLQAARMLRSLAASKTTKAIAPEGRGHPEITLHPIQAQVSLNRASARVLGVDEHPGDLLLEWFRPTKMLRIRPADGPLSLPFGRLRADAVCVRPVTLYQRRSTRAYIINGLLPFFCESKGLIWRWRAARRFAQLNPLRVLCSLIAPIPASRLLAELPGTDSRPPALIRQKSRSE